MNKKEQAELQSLRDSLDSARALRWVPNVEPDVQIPGTGDAFVTGWRVNVAARSVTLHWTTHLRHGLGPSPSKSTYQASGGIALYSTKALGLQALRHALTNQFAATLSELDRDIQNSLSNKASSQDV